MRNHKWGLTACGVAILGLVTAASVGAWGNASHTNHMTFSGSFALPGVTLPAGTYTFERVDSPSTVNIVRVVSRDRSKVYFMGFTMLVDRPNRGARNAAVTFQEAPAGTAPPIAAWYPADSSTGHQFKYR